MLLAGDELGNTQGGNNNAYCAPAASASTDAQAPWALDWAGADRQLLEFVRRVMGLRRKTPALRQPEFFEGRATPTGRPDLMWFGADGRELAAADWHDQSERTLQMWIDGSDVRPHRREPPEDSWLLILHSGAAATITLPDVGQLELELDTGTATGAPGAAVHYRGGATVALPGCTLWALRARA